MIYIKLSLNRKILIISLLINMVYTVAFGGLFYKKKVKAYSADNAPKNSATQQLQTKFSLHPLYNLEKSVFEILPNNKNEIVFLGDSLTRLCQWAELLGNPNVINRGLGRERTDTLFLRLEEVTASLPKKIFIMIGTNDLAAKRNVGCILSDYEKILNYINENSPNTKVYVQSVLPVNNQLYQITMKKKLNIENTDIQQLNKRLKNLENKFKVEYIELFSSFSDGNYQLKKEYTEDGLHLNGSAYLMWKSKIEKKVKNPN